MKDIIKKALVEIIKVVISAALACVGLTASGCYTTGKNSSACLINIERCN